MNLSNTLTRIKLKLGLMNIVTPFEDIDKTIIGILNDIITPQFSIYQPFKETLHINMRDLELLEKESLYEKVLLPDFSQGNRKLLYVFNVSYNNNNLSGLGYYGGGVPLLQGNLWQQTMLANAGSHLMNLGIPKMTFKFEPPRTLYIYNAYASCRLDIELGFEHDKTLASIPETCRESYIQLATLGVKANLYPTLKQYNEINTAIGNINLKIDDWQDAESQYDQLLEKWDDTYHMDMIPMYYG